MAKKIVAAVQQFDAAAGNEGWQLWIRAATGN